MPLDHPNRTRAANVLAAYLRGEIDNFKLDDETLGLRTPDQTLIKISIQIWRFYDDVRRHTVHASPQAWDYLIRCVAYLRSDLEETGDCETRPTSAPFPSDDLWRAHQHLIHQDHLPEYDPQKHKPPRRNAFFNGPFRWRNIAIGVAVFSLFFVVLIYLLVSSKS